MIAYEEEKALELISCAEHLSKTVEYIASFAKWHNGICVITLPYASVALDLALGTGKEIKRVHEDWLKCRVVRLDAEEKKKSALNETPPDNAHWDYLNSETIKDPITGHTYTGQFYFPNGDDVSDRLKMAQ